ncbi:MAG: CDP-glycerol glycerophosphotransferase family protein [Acidobacteriota bacterium]
MIKAVIKKQLKDSNYLYKIASKINHGFVGILYVVLRIVSIDPHKIVFCNFYGKGYSDNPKYIAEELISQGIKCDMVWLLREKFISFNDLPPQIRSVRFDSLRAVYEMATARIWIDNSRQFVYIKKRKGQYYIQTWHSLMPFKKIERDAVDTLPPEYVSAAIEDSKKADLMLAGISSDIDSFRRIFWYDGEVLNCGAPKLDPYFRDDQDIDRTVRDKLNIPGNKKIVLYGPTFRKDHNLDVYDLDYRRCLKALSDRFGGEWIILIRLHPDIMDKASEMVLEDNVYNVTAYEDTQEIISISDVMITDFSGIMFEAAVKKMPCFLYASDLDRYLYDDRGTYFKLEQMPFSCSTTNQALENTIRSFDKEDYLSRIDQFWRDVGVMQDGTASEQVVNRIKSILK